MSLKAAMTSALFLFLSAGSGLAQSHFVYSMVDRTFVTFNGNVNPCSQPGINDSGQIVGAYTTSPIGFPCHGFLKDGNTFTSFDYPNAYVTAASGINNTGQIVGTRCIFTTSLPDCAAFLKDGATFTSYHFPGALFTFANGLNNTGQIAGTYRIEIQVGPNSVQDFDHGLLIDGGVFTPLDFPGAVHTQLLGINDAAAIVGAYRVDIATWPGFRWSGFVFQSNAWAAINYPGALLTFATAINNLGQVVGTYTDSYGFTHGFIKNANKLSRLDVPGADTYLSGINDSGEIVGLFYPRPVADTIGILVITVRDFRLPHGTETSLTSKLDDAAAAFSAGDIGQACSDVADFKNAVRAQSGKKIQIASADDLLARAAQLEAMIGCH